MLHIPAHAALRCVMEQNAVQQTAGSGIIQYVVLSPEDAVWLKGEFQDLTISFLEKYLFARTDKYLQPQSKLTKLLNPATFPANATLNKI